MSDHKWDRFKRSFGLNPSNELINNRNNKVLNALQIIDIEIGKVRDAGLPPGGMQLQRNGIELSRQNALAEATPKAQYESLDTVKDQARRFAAAAPGLAEQQLAPLRGELKRMREAVKSVVDAAEKLTAPQCQAAVANELKAVKEASEEAEVEANDALRLEALLDIDLQPLQSALDNAKPIQSNMFIAGERVKTINKKLAELPDDNVKIGLANRLKTQTVELADLPNEANLVTLGTRAKAVNEALEKIEQRTGEISSLITQVRLVRDPITTVISQAKTIRCDVGKNLIKTELDAVEQELSKADQLGEYAEIAEALGAQAMQSKVASLVLAIASARNIDYGVYKLLAGLDAVIKKLPDEEPKIGFQRELQELNLTSTSLETETVVKNVESGYRKLRDKAEELLSRAIKQTGPEGYRDALSARFGVTVMAAEGANVNLEGVYDTLAAVPAGHVGHEKLAGVFFSGKPDQGGDYGGTRISIDDFEKDDKYTYIVDGKKLKVNGFNVCMLHEIGHAVDEKYKVMASVMNTPGAGQWKSETPTNVINKLTEAACAELTNPSEPLKTFTRAFISDALENKDAKKPDELEISRASWKVLRKYSGIAKAINEKGKPWFNDNAADLAIGDRVYCHSGTSGWFSYSLAERQTGTVRNYQWRSPVEWFADLYGVSWLAKKSLVSNLPPKVAAWLPE